MLHAKEVHVYADNNPLLDVLSSAKLNATGQRWVNNLADFYLQIHYKPGRTNVDADTLSRFPEDINLYHNTLDKVKFQAITDGATTEQHKNEAWLCAMASSQILQEQENKVLQQSTRTLKTVNIKEIQDKDPYVKRVKETIENNILLHHSDKGKEHPTVKNYLGKEES